PQRAGPLTDVLRRLTADDPADRPTAAQAHAELRAIADGRTPAEPPPALDAAPAAPGPRRGRRGVAAAVAITLSVVAGALAARADPEPAAEVPPALTPTAAVPQTATIADPDTADPCSLLDVTAVQPFGTTTLDPDNVSFVGCRADIDPPGGGTVGFTVAFENAGEA